MVSITSLRCFSNLKLSIISYLLLAINDILFLLVGQHTLNSLDTESISDLTNGLGNIHVLVTRLDQSNSNLEGSVGSLQGISNSTSDGLLCRSTNNNSVSDGRAIAINLGTELTVWRNYWGSALCQYNQKQKVMARELTSWQHHHPSKWSRPRDQWRWERSEQRSRWQTSKWGNQHLKIFKNKM